MDNSEFISVIKNTQELVKNNSKWQTLWTGYAAKISEKKEPIENIRKNFRQWAPLYVYLNTSLIKNARSSVTVELRYMGQTVASLTGNKDGKCKLSTNYKYCEKSNRDNFGCDIYLPNVDWRSDSDAKKFRDHFKKKPLRKKITRDNEEHRLESLILTEFFKTESQCKAVLNIQPVTPIKNIRFPMLTYIKASNHKKIGVGNGHIDILTRVGRGGPTTRLCIMELKDKCKDKDKNTEPPKVVVKQALAYATFIRELLRSDCGKAWWKLFGFRGNLPEKLELYAVCLMPSSNNDDKSFGRLELPVGNDDKIVLHYLYFNFIEKDERIKFVSTSIPEIVLNHSCK